MDPLVREFVRYVCSKGGQEVVIKDGYLPLNQRLCGGELVKVE
jgi:phosphate transport system substrate-binding protein